MKLGVMRVVWGLISGVFGLITLVGMICRFLPAALSALPGVPELVSFTPWFIVTGCVALFAALMAHQTVRVWAMVVCIALDVCLQVPFFAHIGVPQSELVSSVSHTSQTAQVQTTESAQQSASTALRVMTVNVYRGHADVQTIVDTVRTQHIQVLTLQETTRDFDQQLSDAGLASLLPYHHRASSDGQFANELWSALPLDDIVSDEVNSSASPMPAGSITLNNGRVLRFVSVHTTSPRFGVWTQWKRSIDEISVLRTDTEKSQHSYVLMGDFNATYDHAPFRAMLGSRFHDGAMQRAAGYTMTWPSNKSKEGITIPTMVSIDHVVVDTGITVTSMNSVWIPGSDHRALIATLSVNATA